LPSLSIDVGFEPLKNLSFSSLASVAHEWGAGSLLFVAWVLFSPQQGSGGKMRVILQSALGTSLIPQFLFLSWLRNVGGGWERGPHLQSYGSAS